MSWGNVPERRRVGNTCTTGSWENSGADRVRKHPASPTHRSDSDGRGPAVDSIHAAHLCTDFRAIRHTGGERE